MSQLAGSSSYGLSSLAAEAHLVESSASMVPLSPRTLAHAVTMGSTHDRNRTGAYIEEIASPPTVSSRQLRHYSTDSSLTSLPTSPRNGESPVVCQNSLMLSTPAFVSHKGLQDEAAQLPFEGAHLYNGLPHAANITPHTAPLAPTHYPWSRSGPVAPEPMHASAPVTTIPVHQFHQQAAHAQSLKYSRFSSLEFS